MNTLYQNHLIRVEIETSEIPWLKIFSVQPYKEFSQCDPDTKVAILQALDVIEKAMLQTFQPAKINIASFGNYLPQVHFHIMARFNNDSFFPEPMWGKKQREGQLALELTAFYQTMAKTLAQHCG